MRKRLQALAYLLVFWILFLITARFLFLSYNYDFTAQLTEVEIIKTFLHGLKMDGSLMGYFLIFTTFVIAINVLIRGKWAYYVIHTFTILALLFSCIIVTIDLELYRHWGFRMNTTPLMYMGPEALGSVDTVVTLKLTTILAILYAAFLFLYIKIVVPHIKLFPTRRWPVFLWMIFVTALMIIPIRGSFTVAPMNTGFVYFHKSKVFANHAAVNVIWNFIYSTRSSAHVIYPEDFLEAKKASALFETLYTKSDTTYNILNQDKPNVLLIILESFTADVIEPLGGEPGVSPNLNALCKEGLLFDNFYASGDRTDKGLISILSGYPAQPQTSIIKYPAKTQRLPYLVKEMQKLGYFTSFTYGGDVDFANFRSYLTSCGFDHITSIDDFPEEWDVSKWGVHDHYVFDQAFHEIDTTHTPFMKVVLSQSSHEPFDVPMQTVIPGEDQESLFLNSCHYTDKSLGEFIRKSMMEPWWHNTVVIITADHGHRHPRNKELKDKERFRIPLLFLGGALAVKDSVIHTYGGQTDIANTLLSQLDQPRNEFRFSKNLLGSPVKSFATYFFNDGFGLVTPELYIIHDNAGKQFLRTENAKQEDLELGKAYQQVLYTDYNKK